MLYNDEIGQFLVALPNYVENFNCVPQEAYRYNAMLIESPDLDQTCALKHMG